MDQLMGSAPCFSWSFDISDDYIPFKAKQKYSRFFEKGEKNRSSASCLSWSFDIIMIITDDYTPFNA